MNFDQFSLHAPLLARLHKNKIHQPTPVQLHTIPSALKEKNLIVTSPTGTGKTLAFLLPTLHKLFTSPSSQALILVPTRELAKQIHDQVSLCCNPDDISTVLLTGGMSMDTQVEDLSKHSPTLMIGTPGRMVDHFKQKTIATKNINILVLDEFDQMMQLDFEPQLKAICSSLSPSAQKLFFSATFPADVLECAKRYAGIHENISLGTSSQPSANTQQKEIFIRKQKSKMDALIEQLATIDGQGIIFCNTKFETWNVQKQLKANQHTAQVLQGDLPQIKRNLVLSAFREKKFQYLVATDLVSRGIDIDHVEIIIHYDIPASHHDYIHRIGRTSRGSVAGTSLALISQDQHDNWINIQNAINPSSNTKHNFSKKHKSSSRKKTHGPSASTKNKRKPRSKK